MYCYLNELCCDMYMHRCKCSAEEILYRTVAARL